MEHALHGSSAVVRDPDGPRIDDRDDVAGAVDDLVNARSPQWLLALCHGPLVGLLVRKIEILVHALPLQADDRPPPVVLGR